MREAVTAEKEMVREIWAGGGGLECWRGYSKRDGERKTEKQLIRVVLVFKRKREQREQYCRERGRDGGD